MNFYPAILTDSLELVQKQINLVRSQKKVKVVQIDIIDGYFVDNLTITPMDLVDIKFHDLKIDFHLMTEEPMTFAEEIVNHGKYFPVRVVIGQVEKMSSQEDFVSLLENYNIMKGLSLDLYTPHEEILDSVFKRLDSLQLMSIEAGAQGHSFNDLVFKKIKQVQARAKEINPNLEVIVDGGVKLNNIEKLANAGVDSVGVGSAIWKSEDISKTLERFCEYAN
jgi:ribulose-phosphate 3-epimerase